MKHSKESYWPGQTFVIFSLFFFFTDFEYSKCVWRQKIWSNSKWWLASFQIEIANGFIDFLVYTRQQRKTNARRNPSEQSHILGINVH